MRQRQITREEVPEDLTWDLTDLFSTVEEWEQAFESVARDLPTVTRFRNRFNESPEVFLACLEAEEALAARLIRVMSHARLRLAADATSPENQAAAGKVSALQSKFAGETVFIRSEALNLPGDTLRRYLEQEPGLESFRPFIEQLLAFRPHALGPEAESILASLGEVLEAPNAIYRLAKTTDISFEPAEDSEGHDWPMSFAAYETGYERSPDPALRRNAFASFTAGLGAYQNTLGATLAAEMRKNVVIARARGFASATDMLLEKQQVPPEVYHRIHDILLGELAPHMRRYARLRREVVGLDRMLYCDIEVPLDPDYQPETSFSEAADIITGGLAVLGEEYREMVESGLRRRWIDRADNVGKYPVAFCNSVYGVHPYILIVWTGSMRDAIVLAHEFGHAGHAVMAQRHQRLTLSRSSTFFVEAPSTVNELLVGDHIMRQSEGNLRMRRWVIEQMLMAYHHNCVRHLIEGELQRRIYRLAEHDQPINAAMLSRVQGEILEDYWGDELEVDEGARLTWMRQHHYYDGLYPYSYAAGLTIGTSVARAIRETGQPAAERWLDVLKAGGSENPLQLAKMAGVDMTGPGALRSTVDYVRSLVDELENSY